MEKQYMLNSLTIRVEMVDGLVRIVNDAPFKQAVVGQPETITKELIERIKVDYESAFATALALRDDSFTIEIWGHLYVDYFLLKYNRILKFFLMFGLYERLCQSCEVIDCGERGKDPNRWLWDRLVPFRKMLARRLGNIRLPY